MRKSSLKFLAMALATVFLLSACAGVGAPAPQDGDAAAPGTTADTAAPSDPAERVRGGTLRAAMTHEPDTLNIYSTTMLGDIVGTMNRSLLIPNEDMEFIPIMATRVPTVENGDIVISPDGQTMIISYHLRTDAYWHDGTPFTSEDIRATWQAVKNPDFIGEGKDGVQDIDYIDTSDPHVAVVHYNTVLAEFNPRLFTSGLMPAHIVDYIDLNDQSDDGFNRQGFIGLGPFKMKEWVAGSHIHVVANDNYFGEGPWFDEIIFTFVPDPNTRFMQVMTGEVDWAHGLNYADLDELMANPNLTTTIAKQNAWFHINFNFLHPILGQNLSVRRAINYCLDKYTAVNVIQRGIPNIADSYWMPFDPFHNPNLPEHVFSVERAIQVLEEDGWMPGPDGIRERDGERLEFVLMGRVGFTDEHSIGLLLAEAAREAGILIELEIVDVATMGQHRMRGEYDMKMHRWITVGGTRTRWFHTDAHAPFGVNDIFYSNPELDELLTASDRELDFYRRRDIIWQIQEMIHEDMVVIPVNDFPQIVAHTNRLRGVRLNPTNRSHWWAVEYWYFAD